MKVNNEILNELTTISPTVAAVPRVNVFSVDAHYFDEIHSELSARISASNFYESHPFTVPQGYFDGLSANILQKIRGEENGSVIDELQELSPLLVSIEKANVYQVPQGYFESIITQIEARLQSRNGTAHAVEADSKIVEANFTKAPAKVVEMSRVRSVFKYAAAAVITGLLGLSVINITDTNSISVGHAQAPTESAVMADANKIIKANSFDKELNNISEADIEQYLQQGGQNVDAALVAASTDNDAALPDATDYLIDDNTLNNFLSENNIKN